MRTHAHDCWRRGAALLLCAALGIMCSGRDARAFDVSLGSLICSVEGQAQSDDAALGTAHLVSCSFHFENGGAETQYVGTLFLQPQAGETRRSFIWIVRGPQSLNLKPGDLAQTYTAGGTITAGTVAPLIPKGLDETVGLFTLGKPLDRAREKGDRRQPKSDPVATLELELVAGPA